MIHMQTIWLVDRASSLSRGVSRILKGVGGCLLRLDFENRRIVLVIVLSVLIERYKLLPKKRASDDRSKPPSTYAHA